MSNENGALIEEETDTDNKLIKGQFADMLATLSIFRTQITAFQQQIRTVDKAVDRKLRQAEKLNKKRRRRSTKPSGFALPSKISEELCSFMSKEKGTHVARTEVTRYIISYIKGQKLQNPDNGQMINPDDALKKLLAVGDDDNLTYFNLQKFMNRHFHKMSKETTT